MYSLQACSNVNYRYYFTIYNVVAVFFCSSWEEDDPDKEEKLRQHSSAPSVKTWPCVGSAEPSVFMSIFYVELYSYLLFCSATALV